MALQNVTVSLPEKTYRKIIQLAKNKNRSVEDELATVVERALDPANEWAGISTKISDEVSQLAFLDDEQLFVAAQQSLTAEKSKRMQVLTEKLKSEGLLDSERQEVRQLQQYAQRIMLIRAEAAILLKQRGHDISTLHPSNSS